MVKKKKITKAILKKREKRVIKRLFKDILNEWKRKVIERDNGLCQMSIVPTKGTQPHHIISLQSVKRKYPELLSNPMNGILLSGYYHKFSEISPHQGGFEFTLWLEKNKPEQYNYLKNYLEIQDEIKNKEISKE